MGLGLGFGFVRASCLTLTLTLARAFATARHHDRRLFEAIGEHARGRMDMFRAQHLANLAWAFAIADVRCEALFEGPAFADACRLLEDRLISNPSPSPHAP